MLLTMSMSGLMQSGVTNEYMLLYVDREEFKLEDWNTYKFGQLHYMFSEWLFMFGQLHYMYGEWLFMFDEWLFMFGEWLFMFGQLHYMFGEWLFMLHV